MRVAISGVQRPPMTLSLIRRVGLRPESSTSARVPDPGFAPLADAFIDCARSLKRTFLDAQIEQGFVRVYLTSLKRSLVIEFRNDNSLEASLFLDGILCTSAKIDQVLDMFVSSDHMGTQFVFAYRFGNTRQ
jgi:hypothetical protein